MHSTLEINLLKLKKVRFPNKINVLCEQFLFLTLVLVLKETYTSQNTPPPCMITTLWSAPSKAAAKDYARAQLQSVAFFRAFAAVVATVEVGKC